MAAARRRFSSGVSSSFSATGWPRKTSARRNASAQSRTGTPPQRICPASGALRPTSVRSRVVLPQPLAPVTCSQVPASTSKARSENSLRSPREQASWVAESMVAVRASAAARDDGPGVARGRRGGGGMARPARLLRGILATAVARRPPRADALSRCARRRLLARPAPVSPARFMRAPPARRRRRRPAPRPSRPPARACRFTTLPMTISAGARHAVLARHRRQGLHGADQGALARAAWRARSAPPACPASMP